MFGKTTLYIGESTFYYFVYLPNGYEHDIWPNVNW